MYLNTVYLFYKNTEHQRKLVCSIMFFIFVMYKGTHVILLNFILPETFVTFTLYDTLFSLLHLCNKTHRIMSNILLCTCHLIMLKVARINCV